MKIDELLKDGREIWGDVPLTLPEVLVCLGVVTGDLSRLARDRLEGKEVDDAELKKELGNIIFSMIRWSDDLGYDPKECIMLAAQAQRAYQQRGIAK